jgi:hypothetical protein
MKLLSLLFGSTDTSTKSPAQVVQRLRELIDDFGITDIVNVTQFRGYLTHEQVLGSIRLFAERVMPVFQLVTAS